jgi:hypothetical protein
VKWPGFASDANLVVSLVIGLDRSHSIPIGTVADLVNASDNNSRHQLLFNDLQRALSNGNSACSPDGGAGCVDLFQASHYIHDIRIPRRRRY